MQHYNNILVISAPELTQGNSLGDYKEQPIMSEANLHIYLHRHPHVRVRKGGGFNCPALMAFDRLRQDIKDRIILKYGDPHKAVNDANSFRSKIKSDSEAFTFYSNFILSSGKNLDPDKVTEYCNNASILNAVHDVATRRQGKAKSISGTNTNLWAVLAQDVDSVRTEIPHTLPSNPIRLREKYKQYISKGYPMLIHKAFCNQNSRKVTNIIETLILSLYALPNKPYTTSVHDLYLQFLGGAIDIFDITSGELFDRSDFLDSRGEPIVVSEATIWNYINNPKNRALVDKHRSGSLDFNNTHRPHHHRHSPYFSLSKISMDDRDLPRKMVDGTRVMAYYSYDVASGCCIGASYSRLKNVSLFIDCMRDMFRFINRNGLGMPMEVEVEHHLVNTFKDDLMKAGIVFPFVRWCAPGNSQEKRAEHYNKAKKYGYEKTNQEGIGRFYARLEANKPIYEKVSSETNDQYKEKTYTFDQLVADDRHTIELYNNDLHKNQKMYPGMTRLQVLLSTVNPGLAQVNEALLARYIGDRTDTSINRSQYVTVQYNKYQLPSPEIISRLAPNNYNVAAYYLPETDGGINNVYLYQEGEFICKAELIKKYNEATAEQTSEDRRQLGKQAAYVNKFDDMIRQRGEKVKKVRMMKADNYADISNKVVAVIEDTPDDDIEASIANYAGNWMGERAIQDI